MWSRNELYSLAEVSLYSESRGGRFFRKAATFSYIADYMTSHNGRQVILILRIRLRIMPGRCTGAWSYSSTDNRPQMARLLSELLQCSDKSCPYPEAKLTRSVRGQPLYRRSYPSWKFHTFIFFPPSFSFSCGPDRYWTMISDTTLLWRRVKWYIGTNLSQKYASSTFRLTKENGDSKIIRNVATYIPIYTASHPNRLGFPWIRHLLNIDVAFWPSRHLSIT